MNILTFYKESKKTLLWKGKILKNIESEQEMSAYGLYSKSGIIVVDI